MSKFHAKAGAGYAFIGDICLEVDKINPQVLSYELFFSIAVC